MDLRQLQPILKKHFSGKPGVDKKKVHSSEQHRCLSDVRAHSSLVIYKSDMTEMIYIRTALMLFTELLFGEVCLPNETHFEVFLTYMPDEPLDDAFSTPL